MSRTKLVLVGIAAVGFTVAAWYRRQYEKTLEALNAEKGK